MVKVIVGQKGSGKTKELIEAIQSAVKTESGSIVCIEKGNSLRYDVSYHVRLVDAKEYQIGTFDQLTGFVSGVSERFAYMPFNAWAVSNAAA